MGVIASGPFDIESYIHIWLVKSEMPHLGAMGTYHLLSQGVDKATTQKRTLPMGLRAGFHRKILKGKIRTMGRNILSIGSSDEWLCPGLPPHTPLRVRLLRNLTPSFPVLPACHCQLLHSPSSTSSVSHGPCKATARGQWGRSGPHVLCGLTVNLLPDPWGPSQTN